jgi:hypothetical protein
MVWWGLTRGEEQEMQTETVSETIGDSVIFIQKIVLK